MKLLRKNITKKLLQGYKKKDVKEILKCVKNTETFEEMIDALYARLEKCPEEKEVILRCIDLINLRIEEIDAEFRKENEKVLNAYLQLNKEMGKDKDQTALNRILVEDSETYENVGEDL